MKPEQANITLIKNAFEKMQSKEDLLQLLNLAKPMVYGEKAVPFELKQLTWYANPAINPNRYREFKIAKKSGAFRSINAPVKGLKSIQKTLSFILQCLFEPHKAVMGFVRNKSIVDNAKHHAGSKYIYNIDLKDFFPSIDQARVWKCLQLKPFNLVHEHVEHDIIVNEDLSTQNPPNSNDGYFVNHKHRNYDYIYRNRRYSSGTWKIHLSNGVFIKYTINDFENKDHFGFIIVHRLKSNLAGLNELCQATAKESGNSLQDVLDEFLLNCIEEHQKELLKNRSRQNLANIISALCCTELEVERKSETGEFLKVKRNVLPQGAPTSPVLSNIVCQRLDFILLGLAKRFEIKYSRYADDITFSSMHNVYQKEGDFLKELTRIITDQGFHIKECKTRLQKEGYRQEVTGLLVNEKANVQQRYIKQLRMWLYYWEKYGYERASAFFLKQYIADKRTSIKGEPNMENVIAGKLDYLKMVKGRENELYLKLKERFEDLTGKNVVKETITNKLNNIVAIKKVVNAHEITENKLSYDYPIRHSPSKTVELLKYFTDNDKNLKYSTHSWEEGKYNSYDEYIEKVIVEWAEIKINLKRQSERLHAKISNFLLNDKLGQKNDKGYYIVWGEKRLKFGWSSPELKIHMNELGKSPFSCKIPDHVKELDKKHGLIYFKDYAEVFKNEIEFREDSKNFKKMILELKKSELAVDFNIIGFEQLVGFSFFTDVHYIKEVIRVIFGEMFKKRPEFPNILIDRISNFDKGFHLISITQKDSFVSREISDKKVSDPSGDLIKIINYMKNLGDYSIVSKFGDGKNYRINYLTSIKMPFIENLPNDLKVEGFTHEFKFYL